MKPKANLEQVSTKTLLPFLIEMLDLGKQVRLTVTGNSMLPLWLNGRDSVILQKVEAPKKYDVVLYRRHNGDVILHRIVRHTSEGYMILGDNQTQIDGPILPSDIIAAVTGFYRDKTYYSVNTWWHVLYCRIWVAVRPLRRILLPLARFVGRLIKHIENGEKHEMDS